MKKYLIFCILLLQVGLAQSQMNWNYSDNFSAECMGDLKNAKVSNVSVSIQNDSIIITDSFVTHCCPKFAMMVAELQSGLIFVTFKDTLKGYCTCLCTFEPRLNIGKFTSYNVDIYYKDVWYSLDGPDFAPIGAEWYYTERFAFSGDIDYLKMISVKDTLIGGRSCRAIQKEGNLLCNGRPDTEYLYEENRILHFWDETFNRFQVLYDMNKAVNDYWIIEVKDTWTDNVDTIKVVVDSISSININDNTFKVLHVTYNVLSKVKPYSYTSKIIEKIGDTQYLFNFYPSSSMVCDANYSDGLRCYNDPNLGNYSTGIAESCTYFHIWSKLKEIISNLTISVFPNPGDGKFEVYCSSGETLTAHVKDITGRLIVTKEFKFHTMVDLTDYKEGLYILTIQKNNKSIGRMKLIKK